MNISIRSLIEKVNRSKKSNKKIREFKGDSLLEFPNSYIVVDVETTDFDYFYGEIIEVVASKYINHELDSSFTSLVRPGEKISDLISLKTGITNEMVEEAPFFSQIAKELYDFLGDSTLIAHHANFDVNFLYDSFQDNNLNLTNDFVDTLRLSRIFIKDSKNHKLKTLAKHFDISKPEHRAEVNTTKALYSILVKLNLDHPSTLANYSNRKKKRSSQSIDFSKIVSEKSESEIDKDNPFFSKNICFTGKMEIFTKAEAAQLVANLGGTIQNNITMKSDILILGDLEYQKEVFGEKSRKHKRAEELQNQGQDIEVMTEITFLELLEI